jgi:FAD binding domain
VVANDPSMTTKDYSSDFGQLRRVSPAHVVHGSGAAGFRQAVAAARAGHDLVIRGRGHSCNGQTLSNGVVFANQDTNHEPQLTSEGHVQVSSGADWYTVERWLNRRSRSIPVLTDHLHVSVGGTVSAGGLGVHSIEHGLQADHVERLRILDGRGEATWCSPSEEPELFRFAAGGMGQVGFIDTMVMRTCDYRTYTHLFIVHHDSITEMMEFATTTAQATGINLYNGYCVAGHIISEVGIRGSEPNPRGHRWPAHMSGAETCTVTDYPFASHSRRGTWIDNFPNHFPLWSDYLLAADQMRDFIGYLDRLRALPPLSLTLKALYFGVVRRAQDAVPFAFAPVLPGTRLHYGIGVYTMVDRRYPHLLIQTQHTLRLLLDHCTALGGRPYLYGVHDLDNKIIQRCYGSDINRLHHLRGQRALTSTNAGVFRDLSRKLTTDQNPTSGPHTPHTQHL